MRYTDASSRQNLDTQPGLGRVISGAGVPSIPSFPKKGPIMLLATLGGLMLALGVAFILEIMSSALSAVRPLSSSGGMDAAQSPAISSIQQQPAAAAAPPPPAAPPVAVLHSPKPSVSSQPSPPPPAAPAVQGVQQVDALTPLVSGADQPLSIIPGVASAMLATHASGKGLQDPDSQYRKAIEPVAHAVAELVANQSIRSLAVVNMTGSALDSLTVSTSLGRMLAMAGAKVAVVDASTGTTGIAAIVPGLEGRGLYDIVSGVAGFSDVVRKDTMTPLQLLPAGIPAKPLSELVESPQLGNALNALEKVYSLTLLHLGDADSSNVALAANSPAVLVVATVDKAAEARDVCDALTSGRVKWAKVVAVAPSRPVETSGRFSNIAATF